MKKYLFLFILLTIIIPINVYAKKTKVKLSKCIDGDTISIIIDKEERKVRFLAVDAPEIDLNEPYSNEAKEFTCNLLKDSKNIYLEYDKNSEKEDKYERILAWVWADDTLVQKELVKDGYARIAYLYGEYKYTSELNKYESLAKEYKLNIWSGKITEKEDHKPEIKEKKKKIDTYLDRINKSYEILVIIIAGILALITLYLKRKK